MAKWVKKWSKQIAACSLGFWFFDGFLVIDFGFQRCLMFCQETKGTSLGMKTIRGPGTCLHS